MFTLLVHSRCGGSQKSSEIPEDLIKYYISHLFPRESCINLRFMILPSEKLASGFFPLLPGKIENLAGSLLDLIDTYIKFRILKFSHFSPVSIIWVKKRGKKNFQNFRTGFEHWVCQAFFHLFFCTAKKIDQLTELRLFVFFFQEASCFVIEIPGSCYFFGNV